MTIKEVLGVNIRSHARDTEHVNLRRFSLWMFHKLSPNTSLNRLAQVHGYHSHATVLHHLSKHEDLFSTDYQYRVKFMEVFRLLMPSLSEKQKGIIGSETKDIRIIA